MSAAQCIRQQGRNFEPSLAHRLMQMFRSIWQSQRSTAQTWAVGFGGCAAAMKPPKIAAGARFPHPARSGQLSPPSD